jgi:hypothetical protein
MSGVADAKKPDDEDEVRRWMLNNWAGWQLPAESDLLA